MDKEPSLSRPAWVHLDASADQSLPANLVLCVSGRAVAGALASQWTDQTRRLEGCGEQRACQRLLQTLQVAGL